MDKANEIRTNRLVARGLRTRTPIATQNNLTSASIVGAIEDGRRGPSSTIAVGLGIRRCPNESQRPNQRAQRKIAIEVSRSPQLTTRSRQALVTRAAVNIGIATTPIEV